MRITLMAICPGGLHAAPDALNDPLADAACRGLPFGAKIIPTATPSPCYAPDAAHVATEEPGN